MIIKARKDNKVYTIQESEIKVFKAKGFDIYKDNKLIERGIGKKVSYEELEKSNEELTKVKEENKKLKAENKELKKAAEITGEKAPDK